MRGAVVELTLIRVAYTQHGTFGVLRHGVPFAVTLERPWLNNVPSRGDKPGSCIPVGTYRCLRCRKSPDYGFKDSPKFGDTFQVFQVPGRSTILFHKGNLDDDTRGCILVGEKFDSIGGIPGIASSAEGFAEFLKLLANEDEFTLKITNSDIAAREGHMENL